MADPRKDVEKAVLDEDTEQRVLHDTTTRERQSRSKRAHEPVDLDAADEQQPVEDDNGPRLPEVNAAESAKVEDPAQPTQSDEQVSGDTRKPSVGKK
jgi:hypothetical protein